MTIDNNIHSETPFPIRAEKKPLPEAPRFSFSKLTKNQMKKEEAPPVLDMTLSERIVEEGKNLGLETITTIAAVNLNLDIQTQTENYCLSQILEITQLPKEKLATFLAKPPHKQKEHLRALGVKNDSLARCEKWLVRISHCQERRLACKSHQALDPRRKDWVASNTGRGNVQEGGLADLALLPSVPVNMRRQEYTDEKKHSLDFIRCGGFYDPVHPTFTLEDLQTFKENPTLLQNAIDTHEKSLAHYHKKGETGKEKANRQALLLLEELKKAARPESIVEKKQYYLDDLMLHLVLAQVEKNFISLQSLEEDGSFCIFHEGLLDELAKTINSTGFAINEGTFMKEMRDTFERFKGKPLIFDGKGPYIDETGGIHLNLHMAGKDKHPKEIKLQPIFSNLTVGFMRKNYPQQAAYNETALVELKEMLSLCGEEAKDTALKLSQVENKLKKNKSTFKMASDLFVIGLEIRELLQKQKNKKALLACSQGCFSAKDRTSAVSESAVLFKGVENSIKRQFKDEKEAKKVRSRVASRIFNVKSLSSKVTHQNTGTKIVKIQTPWVPGISKNLKNIFMRAVYYGKQAHTVIQEKLRG